MEMSSSAAVYSVLDAPAGYVRVHGLEPLQQEQMVLQYVDAHGHISRAEAADLCSLTPDQTGASAGCLASQQVRCRPAERGGEPRIRCIWSYSCRKIMENLVTRTVVSLV
jgi:hypothetical protein